jgi:hypothetical protein
METHITYINLQDSATTDKQQTPWPESAIELYRPNDRILSEKLVLTFADRGCPVVSTTDPDGRILGFLDRSRNYFFQAAPGPRSRPTTIQKTW